MTNDLISRSAVLALAYCAIKPTQDCPSVKSVVDVEDIERLPAIDAVPVVRCKDCALHGHCAVEDMFTLSGFTDGYCRAGKRVSNVVSGARMDGESEEEG